MENKFNFASGFRPKPAPALDSCQGAANDEGIPPPGGAPPPLPSSKLRTVVLRPSFQTSTIESVCCLNAAFRRAWV